jgi:hypothetical protein
MQARLVRRSDLRPTRIRGVVGQKWRTSGYHYVESVQSLCSVMYSTYLVHNIFQRIRAIDGETHKQQISLWI